MSPAHASLLSPARPTVVARRPAAPPRAHAAEPRVPRRLKGPSRPRFGFRPELEGLRAIAVLAVVLYHAGVPFLPGGYVGVDVFFVLSGYLITGLMLAELARNGRLSLSRFYARRIRRLLPAAVLVITATAAASAVILPPVSRPAVGGDLMAAALYVSNWRFAAQATDYLSTEAAPSPVLHYWSLGVEEQFYVIWPLLILLCLLVLRRLRGRRPSVLGTLGWTITGVAVLSLLAGASLTSSNESLAFFGTWTRIWELAAGAVVAVIGSRVLRLTHGARAVAGWLGLLAVAFAVLRYNDDVAYPGWAALLPVVGTALVIVGASARPGTTAPGPARLLSGRRLRRVGQLSYSWYLWHWPVLVLAAVAVGHPLSWWQAGLAVVGSYLLSVLSFRFVESTLRYAPALAPTRVSLLLGVGLTLVAVLASVSLVRSADEEGARTGVVGTTDRIGHDVYEAAPGVTVNVDTGHVTAPKKLTPSPAEAPTDMFQPLYANGCQADDATVTVTSCVMGKKSSNKTMVVIGDSHAAAWAPALDMVAIDRGWRMVPMSKVGCSAALFPVFNPSLKRAYPECDTWRANALQRIKELRPSLIVVANRARYWAADPSGNRISADASVPQVAAGTTAMLQRLRATGARVVYLTDVPDAGMDVPTCVSKNGRDYAACSFPRAAAVGPAEAMSQVARAVPGVQVVDLTDVVCPPTESRCPAVAGNILRYRDSNHMTATFARSLAPQLSAAFPAKL